MIMRIFYTAQQAWHYRKQLSLLQKESKNSTPTNIDVAALQQQGYQTIVFDFDGILAPHGAIAPVETMKIILQQCVQRFGQHHVYVLSNNPSLERLHYFQQYFPDIQFIISQYKKPYPHGLLQIIGLSQTAAEKIVLIDDRLLTGALAALIAKVNVLYVNMPLINLKERPVLEGFFQCLRYLERKIFELL